MRAMHKSTHQDPTNKGSSSLGFRTPAALLVKHFHMGSRYSTDAIVCVILLTLGALSWFPRLNGPIDMRWDGGVYYILGTSLAEGKGYRLLNEPGEIAAVQYPPLLPLFIAMHQIVLGTSDPIVVGWWLRVSFFVIFLVYLLAIYFLLKLYLSQTCAFLGTLACLFNLQTYFMSDLLFPEVPFALVTVLFFLSNRNESGGIYPILTGLFAVAAYALRTIGIALLVAWILESLLNRQFKRAAARVAVSLVPILCWQAYISYVEAGYQYNNPSYEYQRADYLFYNVSYGKNIFHLKDSFVPELGEASNSDIAWRVMQNLAELQTAIGAAVSINKPRQVQWEQFRQQFPFVPVYPWPVYSSLMILSYLIVGGVGLQLARREWFIPLYTSISLAAVCLTPWPGQFNRYLMPLAPFFSLLLFKTLVAISSWSYKVLPKKWKSFGLGVTYSVAALIFAQQGVSLLLVYTKWHQTVRYTDRNGTSDVYRLFFYHDSYRTLDLALEWLKGRARPDEVVAGSMPHWVHLRIGLKSVMPPFEADFAKAQHLLDSVPVNYLILDEGLAVDTRRYTVPIIENFRDRWKRVYTASVITESGDELKNRFQIYERVDRRVSQVRQESRTSYGDK